MALKHAQPLEVIDLHATDEARGTAVSSSLLKTPHLQLLRVVLGASHALPEHHVPGEITTNVCLERRMWRRRRTPADWSKAVW